MADSVDKFVLEYKVKTNDSVKVLENLEKKVEKVGDKSAKTENALGKLKGKFDDVRGSAQSMGSGIDGVISTLGRATPAVASVAGVVALLATSFRMAYVEANRLAELAAKGFSMGVSGIGLESLTRQLSNASNGRISRAGGQSLAEKVGGQIRTAYMDPMQNNVEAQKLRRAGLSTVNDASGATIGTQTALNQLSKSWVGLQQTEIDVRGRLLGLTQAEISAVQGLAEESKKGAAMTQAEAEEKIKAYDAAQRLKSAQTRMGESWDKMKETLGTKLLPAVTSVTEGVEKMINKFDVLFRKIMKSVEESTEEGDMEDRARKAASHRVFVGKEGFGNFSKIFEEELNKERAKLNAKKAEDKKKEEAPATNEQMAVLNQQNAESKAITDKFERAVTSFSGSVAAFGAIDENQAWAAWAAEAGAASGLQGGGVKTIPQGSMIASTPMAMAAEAAARGATPAVAGGNAKTIANGAYDAHIKAASQKYGISEDIIRGVIHTESRGNPNAVSHAGAQGLMQLMPGTAKNVGVTNSFDPAQNIMGGTAVLAENLKKFGNMEDALRAYNGGWKRSNWENKETREYVGKVMSASGSGGGASNPVRAPREVAFDKDATGSVQFKGGGFADSNTRAGLLQTQVINQVAAAMGVPPAQLRSGSMNRGDVQYALGNHVAGLTNRHTAVTQSLKAPGLMDRERAKLIAEKRQLEEGIRAAQGVGGALVGHAREGGREITIGQQRVEIIINGQNKSPEQIANEVKDKLYTSTKHTATVNQNSTVLKR